MPVKFIQNTELLCINLSCLGYFRLGKNDWFIANDDYIYSRIVYAQ